MPTLETLLQKARLIHTSFLGNVVLLAVLGEMVGPAQPRDVNVLATALLVLAFSDLALLMFLRRRLLASAAERLRSSVADPAAQGAWLSSTVLLLALGEAVALLGFVLRILGGTLFHAVPLYAAGFLALLMLTPRLER